MFLKNAWYIAAWSDELGPGEPRGRRILGRPVVLWRGTSGAVVAQEDRCPHRMAPLSMGRVEGESLRCMYHGARFDASGRCVEIPGQEKLPETIAVSVLPVVERGGMIWIWTGDAPADEALVPQVDWLFDPEWTGLRRYMHYDASYELIRDNLLDLSHVAFVHQGTLASSDAAAAIKPEIERFPWGIRTSHSHPDEPLPPYYRGIAGFEGNVDRWYVATAHARSNIVVIEGGSAPAGTGAAHGQYDTRALRHAALHALTPETGDSCHYFYSFRRAFAPGDEGLTRTLADRFDEAFREDKVMIEAQARNIDPDRHMKVINADVAPLYMRSLTRRLLREEKGVEQAGA